MIEMAKATLTERSLAGVRLVRADAAATGLRGGSFDLAHQRLVLCNSTEIEEIVAEMARLVRPGGYVAQPTPW